jgi:DNA-binding response OmpR family regulator
MIGGSAWTLHRAGRSCVRRIAVIDDDEMTRSLLDDVLTQEGYVVILLAGPGDLRARLAAA